MPRVLEALSQAKTPLTRQEISDKAEVDSAWVGDYTGSADAKIRARLDKRFPSLVTLKLARFGSKERQVTYSISNAGRKALNERS